MIVFLTKALIPFNSHYISMFNTVITFNLGSSSVWSSLENYTSNNTRQHDTTRVQHEYKTTQYNTTRIQHDTTRVQHDTARDNTSTTRHNTSTTRHNTSTIGYNTSRTQLNTNTEEAWTAKIELYIALFVTELYFFLISLRNSYNSPTCNIVSTLWTSKAYNTSFRNVKQPGHMASCVKRLSDIKLKIAIQVPKTYIYPPLSRFINNHCGFWKLIFGHQAKVSYKVRRGGYNLEMHFRQFFTYIFKPYLVFLTSIFWAIYRSSSPWAFSKKGVLLQVAYL